MRTNKNGLTLIELTTTLLLLTILMSVAVYVFISVYVSWTGQKTRAGIDIVLDRAIEEMVRDLREAKEINSAVNKHEIRFTHDGSNYYIYYFYNENNRYPPNFDQDFYEVRKTSLTGGMHGAFTYGTGLLIIANVLPPPASNLLIDETGMIITIDLSIERDSERIRSRTEVKPRNL